MWYKDGEEIVPSDDRISVSNEGYMSVLTIRDCEEQDGGNYEVQVRNVHATEVSRAHIIIGDVRAHFLAACAEHVALFVGDELSIYCELSEVDAQVFWTKNGRHLAETERVQMLRSGPLRRLKISGVNLEDGGEYVCATSDERSRTRSRVVVREEVAAVRLSPQDQHVGALGESVTLRCELTRPAFARWLCNGVEVSAISGRHFVVNDETTLALTIVAFDERDAGEYVAELPSGEWGGAVRSAAGDHKP